MGVRGFTTFVNSHPELLSECLLHSTRVIIDGNNFTYWLYLTSHIPCKFGANLDEFRNAVWKFISLLRRCNIEPTFVFDGCHEDDAKWRTSLSRAKERLQIADSQLKSMEMRSKKTPVKVECRNILPILALEAVKQILITDCGVSCTTCDYEADGFIAQLAHDLQVPVFSNDSDFFVYAWRFGAIPFWSINVHAVKLAESSSESASDEQRNQGVSGAERYALKVKIFSVSNLRRFAKLEKEGHAELIPLVAALMGNDIVQRSAFNAFFASVRLGRAERENLPSRPRKQQQKRSKGGKQRVRPNQSTRELSNFDSLFCWLTRFESKKAAIDAILQRVKLDRRASIERLIEACYASYKLNDRAVSDDASLSNASLSLESYHGAVRQVPDEPRWFAEELHRCDISSVLMSVLRKSRLILQTQVEDFNSISSYACCQLLRDRLYATLKSNTTSVGDWNINVIEFGRSSKNMAKRVVTIGHNVDQSVSLCELEAIRSDANAPDSDDHREEKMKLLFRLCDANEQLCTIYDQVKQQVAKEMWFASFVAAFWSTHSLCACESNIRHCFLLALLINLAKLNVVDILHATVNNQPTDDAVSRRYVQTVRDRLKLRLAKYTNDDDQRERLRRQIEIGILQLLAEFQSCTLFLHLANQLCAYALPQFHFARVLNATLVFNLAVDLARRPHPLLFTRLLCDEVDETGQLSSFVTRLYDTLSVLIPAGTPQAATLNAQHSGAITSTVSETLEEESSDSERGASAFDSEEDEDTLCSDDDQLGELNAACSRLDVDNDYALNSENKFASLSQAYA